VTTYTIWLCQIGVFEVIKMCRKVCRKVFSISNICGCSYTELRLNASALVTSSTNSDSLLAVIVSAMSVTETILL